MLNLNLLDDIWLDEQTGMPTIKACHSVPTRLIPFNRARRVENTCGSVHFYIEDYLFSNIWTQPARYINTLARFDSIIAPDFSAYLDMPAPLVRWQIYKRRLLSQWLQRATLNVIYNVQTLQARYDDDQFAGVEGGGVVAIKLPLNFAHNNEGRNEFYRVLQAVKCRLSPQVVLVYGKKVSLPAGINYKFYDNDNIRIRRAIAGRKGRVLA